jgi:excisionase family DNA binding protein
VVARLFLDFLCIKRGDFHIYPFLYSPRYRHNMKDAPEFLTTRQLARKLGISHTTLTNWRSERKSPIPYVKLNGRKVLYRVSDVEEYIRKSTVSR